MDWEVVKEVINSAWEAMSPVEIGAVVFGLLYIILAAAEIIWCWLAAIISVSLYLYIFIKAEFYGDAGLQVFYIVMAVYGWYQWKFGGEKQTELKISFWPFKYHLFNILGSAILVVIVGYILGNFNKHSPYLDAFTTVFAIVATYMVAKKIIENWVYWVVVDSVAAYVYATKPLYEGKPLYLTALLFALYTVLAITGFFSWLKIYRTQDA